MVHDRRPRPGTTPFNAVIKAIDRVARYHARHTEPAYYVNATKEAGVIAQIVEDMLAAKDHAIMHEKLLAMTKRVGGLKAPGIWSKEDRGHVRAALRHTKPRQQTVENTAPTPVTRDDKPLTQDDTPSNNKEYALQ